MSQLFSRFTVAFLLVEPFEPFQLVGDLQQLLLHFVRRGTLVEARSVLALLLPQKFLLLLDLQSKQISRMFSFKASSSLFIHLQSLLHLNDPGLNAPPRVIEQVDGEVLGKVPVRECPTI